MHATKEALKKSETRLANLLQNCENAVIPKLHEHIGRIRT
jgi:hypothetical protein